MAERQQDHFGSPMAAGARGAAREEREGKGGVRNREVGGVEGGDQGRPAGEGGSRWKGETCNSSKPCHVPEEMEAR